MHSTLKSRIEMQDMLCSFSVFYELHGRSNFNEKETFALMQKECNNNLDPTAKTMHQGTNSFDNLKMVVVDFEKGRHIFHR